MLGSSHVRGNPCANLMASCVMNQNTRRLFLTYSKVVLEPSVNGSEMKIDKHLDTEPPTARRRFSAHNPAHIQTSFSRKQEEAKKFFTGFLSCCVISLGCAFLSVPLFRLYCSPQGRGQDAKFLVDSVKIKADDDAEINFTKDVDEKENKAKRKRLLNITCLCEVGNTMPLKFVPLQKKLQVLVGEPSLAFYAAYNKTNRTLLGVSTYSIAPSEATPYLSKIQCFCFEEQRFKPHELVEMPVFFFIEKDFLNDPVVNWLDDFILHYTFFNLESARDYIRGGFGGSN